MARTWDREARRAEIVSAATAAFAERGIAHTAVSDIVKAAGVLTAICECSTPRIACPRSREYSSALESH